MAISGNFYLSGCSVIGGFALPLNAGVLDPAIGPGPDLGHGIGPVPRARSESHVALDHGCPSVALDQDQIPRMVDGARRVTGGEEYQVDRQGQVHTCWNVNQAAVPK